jgi:hypothetical protein
MKTVEQAAQGQVYRNRASQSRAYFLQQAADVLLLLEYPLTETERADLFVLLEQRLQHAYAGDER